jgi:hypothetical protein
MDVFREFEEEAVDPDALHLDEATIAEAARVAFSPEETTIIELGRIANVTLEDSQVADIEAEADINAAPEYVPEVDEDAGKDNKKKSDPLPATEHVVNQQEE